MKQYDLMILGPATRDVNIDYTGEESRIVGGAGTFCTPAAAAARQHRAAPAPPSLPPSRRTRRTGRCFAPSACPKKTA